MRQRVRTSERGQVMVIFAAAFVVFVMMLALLFDGANGLAQRREMQNASDAAVMAGANLFKGLDPAGCSAVEGDPGPPGAPQQEVVDAIHASVAANLPWYNPADIVITCLPGWDNVAVSVDLYASSETFFGSIFGGGPLEVAAHSAAVNGGVDRNQYSVILLNTSIASWPQNRRGCPSMLFSGGPTVRFESSIYIDSTCLEVNGGALSTNGNATSLTLGDDGPVIRIGGEYKPQALTITPAPLEFQAYRPDPLILVEEPPADPSQAEHLLVRETKKKVVGVGSSSGTVVLQPGIYIGGIELRNNSVAYLRPGIYVLYGGGLKLGAQTSVYSVDDSVVAPNDFTTWELSCTVGNCGVMIYNTGTQAGANAMGDISVAAGSTFKVTNYDSSAPDQTQLKTAGGSLVSYSNPSYDNMLIWQAREPASSDTWAQPELHLNGGGNVSMTGTVYAPSAKVLMGGTSGGSGGGGAARLVLQFVVWDMEISGNATFEFVYDGDETVKPPDYGLIE